METEKPQISIIVPVYNGEKWIRRCVEGIFAQTYKDWELIIIDDGSKDGTLHFLNNSLPTLQKDSGIYNTVRIVSKPNGGVSSARNRGIEIAQGEYLAFIDVDDVVEPTYLEVLSEGLGFDFVITSFCYDYVPQGLPKEMRGPYKTKETLARHMDVFLNTDHFCFPWARLFKTSIITENSIRFDTGMRFAEDHVFNWTYLCHIKSIFFAEATPYHKMSDDVDRKYNLSLEEVTYVDSTLYRLKGELEKSYNKRIYPSAKTFCHVLFLKDYISSYTCSFFASYFLKFHPEASEHEVYDYIAHNIYHPGLQLYKKGIVSRKVMGHFLDQPWSLFRNTKLKSRIWIPFLIL